VAVAEELQETDLSVPNDELADRTRNILLEIRSAAIEWDKQFHSSDPENTALDDPLHDIFLIGQIQNMLLAMDLVIQELMTFPTRFSGHLGMADKLLRKAVDDISPKITPRGRTFLARQALEIGQVRRLYEQPSLEISHVAKDLMKSERLQEIAIGGAFWDFLQKQSQITDSEMRLRNANFIGTFSRTLRGLDSGGGTIEAATESESKLRILLTVYSVMMSTANIDKDFTLGGYLAEVLDLYDSSNSVVMKIDGAMSRVADNPLAKRIKSGDVMSVYENGAQPCANLQRVMERLFKDIQDEVLEK